MRRLLLAAILACLGSSPSPAATPAPYDVASRLFDVHQSDLGLAPIPGAHTVTIHRATDATDHYANGAALVAFRGRLFAQWQSSPRDEDSPDTWVACSTSADAGETWTTPRPLAAAGAAGVMRSSGGWWTDGHTLVAFLNIWPHGFGATADAHTAYRLSTDGENWSAERPVLAHDGQPVLGIIEQDIYAYRSRLHVAFHLQPGLIATPHFTDDPLGLAGWTAGTMPHLPTTDVTTSRELEPSLFARPDGSLVMVFRDQSSTYRQLAAESHDRGVTWTEPALTAMPDSRAKQSAGNLPDGSAFLVNCPSGTRERLPLALTLSRDGRTFDRSFLLRGAADLPPLRFPGKFKRPGYHYPKSFVTADALYVIYATNKEDVELTRVPLAALVPLAPPPAATNPRPTSESP